MFSIWENGTACFSVGNQGFILYWYQSYRFCPQSSMTQQLPLNVPDLKQCVECFIIMYMYICIIYNFIISTNL